MQEINSYEMVMICDKVLSSTSRCHLDRNIVHFSLKILSMFSFTQGARSCRLAFGNKPYSASRVCLFVLHIQSVLHIDQGNTGRLTQS